MSECTCYPVPFEDCITHYGAVEPGSAFEPNPNCPEHFRKPPHRLADGTWSDGVDRTRRIIKDAYAYKNPGRYSAFKNPYRVPGGNWIVQRGTGTVHQFYTHAEAIVYADRAARTTKNGENNE